MADHKKVWMSAAAALSALAMGGALFVAAPLATAGGGPPVKQATVTPDPSSPGEAITIGPATASDVCPGEGEQENRVGAAGASGMTLEWEIRNSGDEEVDDGVTDADLTGVWEVDTNAPASPGVYTFYGACEAELNPVNKARTAGDPVVLQQYIEEFTVAGEPQFSASLDKSSGPAGQNRELTAIVCDGDSGAAALLPLGDPPPTPFTVDEDILQQYDVIDGQFGGVVPVPEATAPGTYQVVVWCMLQTRVRDSVVLGYTVTGAVAAEPTFTG